MVSIRLGLDSLARRRSVGWVGHGGRPWDRDMALGTIPSTAAGMPVGATLTTPGGYLL